MGRNYCQAKIYGCTKFDVIMRNPMRYFILMLLTVTALVYKSRTEW